MALSPDRGAGSDEQLHQPFYLRRQVPRVPSTMSFKYHEFQRGVRRLLNKQQIQQPSDLQIGVSAP